MHYQSRSITKIGKVELSKLEVVHEVAKKAVSVPVHHIFACDISGSMWDELPKMRKHLIDNLPKLIHKGDVITIIAFSGKNECFRIGHKVDTTNASEMKVLTKSINTYLKPKGMTCFLSPVEMLKNSIESGKYLNSFIFLTDGGHNEAPWSDVISLLNEIHASGELSRSTFVEYGFYADTNRLNEMAEITGGVRIVSEDFDQYVSSFDKILNDKVNNLISIDVSELKPAMERKFLVGIYRNNVVSYSVANTNELIIPEDTNELYYLGKAKLESENDLDEVYTAEALMAYYYASKVQYNQAEAFLKMTRDKYLQSTYSSAYGKQKLNAFLSDLNEAIINKGKRYIDGHGQMNSAVSRKYCVVDFLNDMKTSYGMLCLTHPEFNYSRIGVKSVIKQELTDEQQAALKKVKSVNKAKNLVKSFTENGLKMSYLEPNKGYPIWDLTWNEDRANVSVLVTIPVSISLPKNDVGLTTVNANIYRNYTIIKDGILNVNRIPGIITQKTVFDKFKKLGILAVNESFDPSKVIMMDISKLPLINASRAKQVDSKELASMILDLYDLKVELKYLGYLRKKYPTFNDEVPESTSYFKSYGFSKEQIDYLKGIGINDKGIFSPKTELDEKTDQYLANSLKVLIKNYSSIPKIEDVLKKDSIGKQMTPSELFLKYKMDRIDSLVGTDSNKIANYFASDTDRKVHLADDIAMKKFGMTLSHRWFKDKKSYDDNECNLKLNGYDVCVKFEFRDVVQYL